MSGGSRVGHTIDKCIRATEDNFCDIEWDVAVLHQFGQIPNSAVFRYRKSRVVELPNSEVFVLFPLLASVCYNVWNIGCLENLWGEYVRKWLNLLKIDDNSWQLKKNRAVVSIRVPKGKRVRIWKFNDPKTSDIGRLPNSGFARTDMAVSSLN